MLFGGWGQMIISFQQIFLFFCQIFGRALKKLGYGDSAGRAYFLKGLHPGIRILIKHRGKCRKGNAGFACKTVCVKIIFFHKFFDTLDTKIFFIHEK